MKRFVVLAVALGLSGCAASPEKLAAQDETFCANMLSDKPVYLQCRQNQQAKHERQAAADSMARSQALSNLGEVLSATGDAMRASSPSRHGDDD
jgi:hypothetical protein